jgi:hypothetical protein
MDQADPGPSRRDKTQATVLPDDEQRCRSITLLSYQVANA